MNITTRSRYALRALADIATHEGDRPVRRIEVANRQRISPDYLEQIFVLLRQADIVKSIRGPGGGYRLTRHAQNITVWDVVSAVEDKLDLLPCIDRKYICRMRENCMTRGFWNELQTLIEDKLKMTTILDLSNSI